MSDEQKADYSQMTNDEFRDILADVVVDTEAATLLDIPGIYEVLSEHFNNDVLDKWAEDNPDKAYPEAVEDDKPESDVEDE